MQMKAIAREVRYGGKTYPRGAIIEVQSEKHAKTLRLLRKAEDYVPAQRPASHFPPPPRHAAPPTAESPSTDEAQGEIEPAAELEVAEAEPEPTPARRGRYQRRDLTAQD